MDDDGLQQHIDNIAFMAFCSWAWHRSAVFRFFARIFMAWVALFVLAFLFKFVQLLIAG